MMGRRTRREVAQGGGRMGRRVHGEEEAGARGGGGAMQICVEGPCAEQIHGSARGGEVCDGGEARTGGEEVPAVREEEGCREPKIWAA